MKGEIKGTLTVQHKKYEYTLKKKNKDVIFFECKGARISQDFLAEDIPDLLIDLPNLIIAEKEHQKNRGEVVRFRVSSEDKHKIEKKAAQEGYNSISDYVRSVALGS